MPLQSNLSEMKKILDQQLQEVLNPVKYRPCVSLIMSFEPKMSNKHELEARLRSHLHDIEHQLISEYPAEKVLPVLNKLHSVAGKVDYNSYKRSLAIYVSPLIERIYYLDIEVKEKMIIDETFEIRDLVYNKKEQRKFLLLHIGAQHSSFYLFDAGRLSRVKSNSFSHIRRVNAGSSDTIAELTESDKGKEMMIDKFLRLTDESIDEINGHYPFPIFLIATEKVIGHFKKVSHSLPRIAGYIHGNFETLTERQVSALLNPQFEEWNNIYTQSLLIRIEAAFGASKLSYGVEQVWDAAVKKNCKLLIVEKNFICPAEHGETPEKIVTSGTKKGFYIKDAVDDIIEMVLLNGGDVEFVEDGSLSHLQRIALIHYY